MPFSISRRAAPEGLTGPVRHQTAADSQALVFRLTCEHETGSHDASNEPQVASRTCSNCSSRWWRPTSIAVLQASSHGSSSTAAAASTTNDRHGASADMDSQRSSPAASDALCTGLVPALFLGDVFITANTVAGIINSSATAAAEGRMPTARQSRGHKAAQQQQHQLDPSSALLLKLMQPLPQPFPSVGSSSDQQQQRMLFYVQKECAEFVRQELLLHRYNEVVAVRAAAGLPTTAAEQSSNSPLEGHRKTMLEHIQEAITGGSSSNRCSDAHSTADSKAVLSPLQGQQQQQQQQQQHALGLGVGKVMQDLHAKVIQLVPGWQQQQHDSSSQNGGTAADGTAAGTAHTAASTTDSKASNVLSSSGTSSVTTTTTTTTTSSSSSSSSNGMVGARRGLPAVLAAQLSSFMSDLHTLEEEAVLREGQQLLAQRKKKHKSRHNKQHGGSSSSRFKQAVDGSSSNGSGAGHAAFNFASYVARIPLAAAMQLVQPRPVQQQQQDSSTVDPAGPASSSSSSSGYDLAISGGDLRACLAVQHRDAFVDLDDISPHHDHSHTTTWQLGVYEPSSDEDDEDEDHDGDDQDDDGVVSRHQSGDRYITNNQRKIAAAAALTEGSDGGSASKHPPAAATRQKEVAVTETSNISSSNGRAGRFRWGDKQQHQQQHSPEITRQHTGHQQHQDRQNGDQDHCGSDLMSNAAYTALSFPGGVRDSSDGRGVALGDLEQQQQQLHEYGEVKVPLSDADMGVCDRTPVFQVPGLEIILDTSHGEVSFTPTFLSLAHLVALLHTAKTAATKIWINNRRTSRRKWRHSVEMAAAALAAGSSASRYGGSSGYGGGSSRSAADDDSDEDEDGMGDPPEAKALLEELGESQPGQRAGSNRGNAGDRGGSGGVIIPNTKGLSGFLNTVALGSISLAAAGCCAAQELFDQTAMAVPAVGEWVIGFPNSVNIKAAFLEDLAAAAATYNKGKLKPPKTAQAAAGGTAAVAASSEVGDLYDPLGLVTKGPPTQQQQQQQHVASSSCSSAPAVALPCLDGLRLLLAAGWSVLSDVVLSDGSMAGQIISSAAASSSGRRLGLGTLQVTEEGEIALRLGLAVKAAPVHMMTPSARQQLQHSSSSSSASETHAFDVGIHVNLSHLIGVPSMQQADQLAASRGGLGAAAQGILLIGDLALDPSEMTETVWRAPQLGFGVLPVRPLLMSRGGGGDGSSSSADSK